MTKSTELNRRDVATITSRKTDAYNIMKAMYLAERGTDKFPRLNRAPDYSDFDEWLTQKKKEWNC